MILMLAAALALDTVALDTGDADLLAKYDRTGERSNCLPNGRQTDFKIIGETLMLVESGGRFYLTETSGSCARANNSFYRMELKIFGGQICQNQIVQVVDTNGFYSGSCSLGDFERLTKKPKQDDAQ